MDIYLDIETLRSPEEHRMQIIDDVKENFKAPSSLSKGQAAIDFGQRPLAAEPIRCNVPLQPLRWSQMAIEVLL